MKKMILVVLTALAVVCGADKLDSRNSREYLPPNARTAGGSLSAIDAPYKVLPSGSYENEAQGIVVDAINPGIRTSGAEPTGLGGPRASYGSTDSKVGNAAFTGSVFGANGVNTRIAPGFGSVAAGQTEQTGSSSLKFANAGSNGYDSDNGIAVGVDGVGSGASGDQGAHSYKSDGTYNAQKYNAVGEYNNGDVNGSYESFHTGLQSTDVQSNSNSNLNSNSASSLVNGVYASNLFGSSASSSKFGSAGKKSESDSSSGASYSEYTTASPSSALNVGQSGQNNKFGNTIEYSTPSSSSAFASVAGNQGSFGLGNQNANAGSSGFSNRFGGSQFSTKGQSGSVFGVSPSKSSFSPSAQSSQYGSSSSLASGQYKPQSVFSSSFASSTQKPSSQQQGADSSYYYNPPSQSFNGFSSEPNFPSSKLIDTSSSQSNQFSYNNQGSNVPSSFQTQQGSKYYNTQIGAAVVPIVKEKYQTTASPAYGKTQTSASNFPSGSPTAVTQFGSQFSQFGSKPLKPSTQFSQSTTSNQYGVTGSQQSFGQKPVTDFGQKVTGQSLTPFGQQSISNSQTSDSQEYQGTLYQYNKPAESLPASSQSASSLSSGYSSDGSSYNSGKVSETTKFVQKPFGGSQTGSSFLQNRFGSTNSQFAQKPVSQVSSFGTTKNQLSQSSPVSTQYYSTATQKPFGSFSSGNQQFGSQLQGTAFGFGTGSSQSSQLGSQLGSQNTYSSTTMKPFGSTYSGYQQTQFGTSGSQFGLNKQTGVGSSFGFGAGSAGQSAQTSKFGSVNSYSTTTQKPFSSSTPSYQQSSSFGYGKKNSYITTPKPFGSLNSLNQQTQFVSSVPQFSQNKQTGQGSTIGFGGSTQTSQYGSQNYYSTTQKPFGSSVSSNQQYGSYGTQLGQNSKYGQGTSFGIGTGGFGAQNSFSSTTTKPFGSTNSGYQQAQYGSSVSQLSKNKQNAQVSSFGSGSIGSQFGSQNSYSTTTKKPFGSSTSGYQQFGSSGSQFGQGLGQGQTSEFGKKPFNSAQSTASVIETTQFGLTSSPFVQKPQISQVSSFGSKSQSTSDLFVQKPFASTQLTSSLGSTGSQYGLNSQYNKGSSFGTNYGSKGQFSSQNSNSNYDQGQYSGSYDKTQSSLGSTSTSSEIQNRFGQASQLGQYGQQAEVGTFGSQYSQKPSTQGASTFDGVSGTSQFSSKPQSQFGSQAGSSFQSSVGTEYSQQPAQSSGSTIGSYSQPSQYPYGSSTSIGQKPQSSASAYASTIGSKFDSQGVKYSQGQVYGSQESVFKGTNTHSQPASQFGSPISQSVQSGYSNQNTFGTTAKPFGSQSSFSTTQSPFSYQNSYTTTQKPFASQASLQPTRSQVGLGTVSSQSSFGSVGLGFPSRSSFGENDGSGYKYQQPQSAFSVASGAGPSQYPGQSVVSGSDLGFESSQFGFQPSQGIVVTTAKPQFGSQSFKPAGSVSSFSQSTQYGAQSVKPGSYQYGTVDSSVQPTQTAFITAQSPSQSFSASTLSPGYSTTLATNRFGGSYDGTAVSTVQTYGGPISSIDESFGIEQFGGPRDPPKFDQTGYHY